MQRDGTPVLAGGHTRCRPHPGGPQGLILLPACSSCSRLPAPSPRCSGVPGVPGAASRSRDHPMETPVSIGPLAAAAPGPTYGTAPWPGPGGPPAARWPRAPACSGCSLLASLRSGSRERRRQRRQGDKKGSPLHSPSPRDGPGGAAGGHVCARVCMRVHTCVYVAPRFLPARSHAPGRGSQRAGGGLGQAGTPPGGSGQLLPLHRGRHCPTLVAPRCPGWVLGAAGKLGRGPQAPRRMGRTHTGPPSALG